MLKILKAGLISLAVMSATSGVATADKLKVMSGSTSDELNVPMNRAVVVESDEPFAEISVANASIADISTLSDRSIYVLGRAPGQTTMTLLAADGSLITNVQILVTPDVTEFKQRLQQVLPGEKIEVRTANDGIVLSGIVSSVSVMEKAVELASRYAPDRVSNLLSIGGTQQVMLKVRFAEMQRSVSKNLSASLGLNGSVLGGGLGIQGGSGAFVNQSNVNNAFDGDSTTGVTSGDESNGRFLLGGSVGGLEIAVALEALEQKGVVRTLAEPNLTALSGQQAKFLAGGEYPIPVLGENGVYIDYKPFGVELEFIPRVIEGSTINLEMKASVSALDSTVTYNLDGFSLNAFKRRETSTTVEMRDGESFAIAGLLQDDFQDMAGQVPWLGDVPILGALFRSADYTREQSELVIIVTPHLVSPTKGIALSVPTDRIQPPTESELFLFGKTAGSAPKTGAAAEVAKQDFSGSYGYVME
ncbi:Type II secretion system protein D precursor [Aquimixticola soesokkakensis]|uniref:Type II secretion system protein D n=2 Tax=Aquimixticola soesokkakensis TaxID=1519096 RepID=A0A1Y5S5T4_9RHOB|nr:Type II secretion system protein D precursor [Aquimixticola soesokkakensis]